MQSITVSPITYVLELENNKWYVGASLSLNVRLAHHFNGSGAKWTQLHKPIRVNRVEYRMCEKELTLLYMHLKGWENVRGSYWCKVELKKPPALLQNLESVNE